MLVLKILVGTLEAETKWHGASSRSACAIKGDLVSTFRVQNKTKTNEAKNRKGWVRKGKKKKRKQKIY